MAVCKVPCSIPNSIPSSFALSMASFCIEINSFLLCWASSSSLLKFASLAFSRASWIQLSKSLGIYSKLSAFLMKYIHSSFILFNCSISLLNFGSSTKISSISPPYSMKLSFSSSLYLLITLELSLKHIEVCYSQSNNRI